MQVLVTGSNGFIGKNLLERLSRVEDITVSTYAREDAKESLEEKVLEADFIFHLAGINRPENPEEFYEGNRDLTQRIVNAAKKSTKDIPILMTSSTQAERDNDYGKANVKAKKHLKRMRKRELP